MSSENVSTLRVRGQAEFQQLLDYEKAVWKVVKAHQALQQVTGGGAAPASGGTNANQGAPPPAPAPLPRPPGAAAPASPQPPGAAPAPAAPAPAAPAPAAPATAPAAPTAAPATPAPAAPAAATPAASSPSAPRKRQQPSAWQVAGSVAMHHGRRGMGFGEHTASTALGVGLGSSLFGLPLTAINRYMQLSTILTQVDRKFRDASDSAEIFGTSMGYGLAQSAALADALGAQVNQIDRREGVRMLGLARYTGADASTAVTSLGRVSALGGRYLGNGDLADMMRVASDRGMDRGRINEFLQLLQTTAQSQFDATGATSMQGALTAMSIPSLVYGLGDPRRGHDMSMVGGLHSVLTSGGPMQSYMMRAMGYGRKDGPGYIEMRKQLEGGVYDPRNLIDLFSSFQERGMGRGAMFRAIESVAGGSLKAHQIEALVDSLGTKEGLLKYGQRSVEGGGDAISVFKKLLSKEDAARFDSGGFAELGKQGVSAGESYQNRIEHMMMKVGGELAQGIPNLQSAIESLGRGIETILGKDLGSKIEKAAGHLETMAKWFERNAVPLGQGAVDVVSALPAGPEQHVRDSLAAAARVSKVGRENGVGLGWLVEGAEVGIERYFDGDIGGGPFDYWTGPDMTESAKKAGGGPR